jgi:magnesium-transporting ATPase (P-type)
MFKRLIFLGVFAGLLSGIVSLIYSHFYNLSLGSDFSAVVKSSAVMISSVIGCVIASVGYYFFYKWLKRRADAVFYIVFVVLCLLTLIPPFAFKLPLTISNPELFPGMVIPMHLFPPLAWLTLRPLFLKSSAQFSGEFFKLKN